MALVPLALVLAAPSFLFPSSPLDTRPGPPAATIPADLGAGRNAEAISACFGIIEQDPADVAAYAWLFQALEETPAQARAAAVLDASRHMEKLLREHPGDVHYQYGSGVLYRMQDKPALAHERLKESISRGADFMDAYSELVNGYRTSQDIEDTAAFLRARLKLSPDNAFLHQSIGLVHYYSSEYHDARASLEKAVGLFRGRGAPGR